MRPTRTRHRPRFSKEAYRIAHPDEGHAPGLTAYLRSARIDVVGQTPGSPLEVRLAHYAQTTLALVSTPEASVVWRRTEQSRDRTVMLLARTGGVTVSTPAPVMRRGRTAVLIPPGDAPVEISTTAPHSELVYVSTGAHVAPPAAARLTAAVDAPALPWHAIAPLYAFVHALCSTPVPPEDEPDLLSACSEVIVDACARTILGDISVMESIVLQVRTFIDERHTDPTVTASSIAPYFGIATRTLQAAFAAEGSTVRGELRHARLRTARRLQEKHPQLAQTERAHAAGFASLSAMYRAFQAEARSAAV